MNWRTLPKVTEMINQIQIRRDYIVARFFTDLKKLVKYEEKSTTTSTKHHSRLRQAPENIINVTIVKESSPQKVDQVPITTAKPIEAPPENTTLQHTENAEQPDAAGEVKRSKRLLRLPKHIKTRNPKIVYKNGIGCGARNGLLIRNTPTDLYRKYQDDWMKFKAFIPGESSRTQLRRSIRRKMQHKDDDDDAKVGFNGILMDLKWILCAAETNNKYSSNLQVYVHFPDETGDY